METAVTGLTWRTLGIAGWLVATTSSLSARQATVFDQLEGAWRGVGSLMGRPAEFSMRWDLSPGLATLTFSNAFAADDGPATPVLNAAAVYRTAPATPEAVWLDSRGVRVQIRWEATDSVLVSHWTAPTESGRTTYRVISPDEVDVLDEVSSGGALRTFGTARYVRRR